MQLRPQRSRRLLFRVAVLALSLVSALAACELLLRAFAPATTEYAVLLPGTDTTFHPDPAIMPGVEGEKHFVVNSRGIRARELGPDGGEYRILAVGGSTTECLYLDQSEAWTQHLEQSLGRTPEGKRVWVGNVGRSGLSTRDHVLEVKFLPGQIPELDCLLVLTGVNDLTAALKQGERYVAPPPVTEPAEEKRQIQRVFLAAPGSLHEPETEFWLEADAPWFKRTALWQLLKRAEVSALRLSDNPLNQDQVGQIYVRWRANRQSASRLIDRLPNLDAALAEYARNLEAILALARARSLRLVFLTQPSLWRADLGPAESALLWLGGIGEFQSEPRHAYYSVRALAEGMALYNQRLRELCAAHGQECMDLAARLAPTLDNFYDDVHLTARGSEVVGQVLTEYFRGAPPFAPAPGAR